MYDNREDYEDECDINDISLNLTDKKHSFYCLKGIRDKVLLVKLMHRPIILFYDNFKHFAHGVPSLISS